MRVLWYSPARRYYSEFAGRRRIMKNGFHVYDADTHVNPAAEVLERYVDPSFRPRLAELAPYRQASGEGRHHYGFGRKFYRRVLGEAAPRGTFTGRESQWRGGKLPRPGVQDDQAENRVKDMDDEGTDVHIPNPRFVHEPCRTRRSGV